VHSAARKNHTKSLSLIIVLQISEKQKLRFKSATHTVPPTFSGLSNQIAKEQTDERPVDTFPADSLDFGLAHLFWASAGGSDRRHPPQAKFYDSRH
jgi:hypothetical protein